MIATLSLSRIALPFDVRSVRVALGRPTYRPDGTHIAGALQSLVPVIPRPSAVAYPTVSLLRLPATSIAARPGSGRGADQLAAGLSGLLAGGTAIAVGHLAAVLIAPAASPLLAVGATFIDLTPEWLKSFAIRTFGTSDKVALLAGIGAVLAIAAIAIGVVGLRRPRVAVSAVGALGIVGAFAAALRPGGSLLSVVPAVIGAAVGMIVLVLLLRELDGRTSEAVGDDTRAAGVSRRRFLAAGAATGGLILASGGLAMVVSSRRSAAVVGAARPAIPAPLEPLRAVKAGADLGIDGVAPFITPNETFYRVDTALAIPAIAPDEWRLRIHGLVDREITLTLADLLAYPTIERDITLTCVSNEVGGEYAGNARWIGIPLATVLEEAGVQAGADQVVSRSVDGMSIGTPTAVALDGRDAMLAIAMNGKPLPPVHGYPVRMIVPGLFGYVSACKWLVELELTTFDAYDPYWVERGWVKEAPIKTMSRIDTPKPLAQVAAGRVAIAGVAWAQHRGVDRVEVRIDGADWATARLADVDTIDTWRQWVLDWDATPGRHTLEVRATDATGATQPEQRATPFPDGATGWHSVVMTVT
jgi:DMSO/TMAO reductase YedYZ molybdopterin-dependent catalytic subunit